MHMYVLYVESVHFRSVPSHHIGSMGRNIRFHEAHIRALTLCARPYFPLQPYSRSRAEYVAFSTLPFARHVKC